MKPDPDYKEFLFEYEHEGGTWNITIKARDQEDAIARMKRMSLARYCGEVVLKVKIPFDSFLTKLFRLGKNKK